MDMILVKSKSGMRMVDRKGQKGFLELDEPVWASDDHFRACPACNSMFDMFKRKHHCRRCGGVFCGDCATDKVIPRRLRFIDPVKMCGKCQKVSKWENDFFENYQKKLKSGLELNVETEKDNKVDRGLATVTLVEDGSVIEITSESGPYMPILMNEVTSFRIAQEGSNGVHTLHIDSFGGQKVTLSKTEIQESVIFLNGLRKALKMSAKPDHQKSGHINSNTG